MDIVKNKYRINNRIELEKDLFIEYFKEKIEFSELLFFDAFASSIFRTNKSNRKLTGYIKDDRFKLKRKRRMISVLFAYSTAKGEIISEGKNTIIAAEIKISNLIIFSKIFWLLVYSLIVISLFENNGYIIIPIILIIWGIFPFFKLSYDVRELKRILENEINDIVLKTAYNIV